MASNKIYYVRYFVGNTNRLVNYADNPMWKGYAIQLYEFLSHNGWRVWVEDNKGVEIAKNF